MRKSIKKWRIPLHNKYVFFGLLIISIVILTTINNYYFYAHVARENKRNAAQLEIMVKNSLDICVENKINPQICTKKLIQNLDKMTRHSYYLTSAILKDSQENILWQKSQNEHDMVAIVNLEIILPDLNNSNDIIFNDTYKWSNANIALSVYRSMTFSATYLFDVYERKGIEEAVKRFFTIAWYRSRPAIGFTLFTILLFGLYRNREKKLLIKERKKEEELRKAFKKNKLLTLKTEELEAKYETVYNDLIKHDNVLNPPINTLTFNHLVAQDTAELGTKFRKTLEKLLFPIYIEIFNKEPKNLSETIYKLEKNKIITSTMAHKADIVRMYGNLSSHFNKTAGLSKEESIYLAGYIIEIVEELASNNLLND